MYADFTADSLTGINLSFGSDIFTVRGGYLQTLVTAPGFLVSEEKATFWQRRRHRSTGRAWCSTPSTSSVTSKARPTARSPIRRAPTPHSAIASASSCRI
ncbi:MAG: hypothetical protein MZV65_33485 [Chromatiales bacterium]|nr:hypothetical protein [Chromatiales bacterium]